ncbi:MAG: RNA polymerase sigma factor [Bacteroidales bacterium]|nr:RNA polymerase sigma factor [Bacteroidales bacterium]
MMKANSGNIGFGSDEALMEAVSQGRTDALNVLMDRYMSAVYRISYRILCDRADSEVVTRNVLMKAWSDAPRYDGRYSLMVWIYQIVCHLCIARLRRRRILDLLSVTSSSVYEMSAPQSLSPEEDYIIKETWEIFCRASRNLSPKQRIVFTLRELEGLSTDDISAITGLNQDRIDRNIHIAHQQIRSELEHYGKVR